MLGLAVDPERSLGSSVAGDSHSECRGVAQPGSAPALGAHFSTPATPFLLPTNVSTNRGTCFSLKANSNSLKKMHSSTDCENWTADFGSTRHIDLCKLRTAKCASSNRLTLGDVLVQPEMEKRRSPLVSIPPFGRGFSRHGVFRSDGGWAAQERALTPPFIVSMIPPGYPSAWLRPRSARFRFARQNHCNSATSCRFSTSGLPVTPPEPRPARPES